MGTGTGSRNIKAVKLARCSVCGKIPQPDCDWQQGRCPHVPSVFDNILSDPYKTRFYNLINFFIGRK